MLHKTSPFKDIVRKSADNCILIDQKCLNLTYNKVTVFELELLKENVFKISSKNHGKVNYLLTVSTFTFSCFLIALVVVAVVEITTKSTASTLLTHLSQC